jgi:hypothetical protein
MRLLETGDRFEVGIGEVSADQSTPPKLPFERESFRGLPAEVDRKEAAGASGTLRHSAARSSPVEVSPPIVTVRVPRRK